jgi:predicted dehydrogenase
VIGATPYAETHLARLNELEDAVLVAIAGRDADRAAAVAARYGAEHAFAGYEALLDSGTVDAVLVVAPDELHEPIALAAFERGIHVLCEKPLARDPEQARTMALAAERTGLVNMSYFALRTTPAHRHVKELVDAGAIGAVHSAQFSLQHGFFRSDEYNWRFDATRGGGVVADLGCYVFDLARWYTGSEVRSVAAHGASQVHRPHPDGIDYPPADDSSVGLLAFDSGAHASFELSVVADIGPGFQRSTVQLQGELGRIELDHTFADAAIRILRPGDAVEVVEVPGAEAYPSGDAEFIAAVRGGDPVRPAFADGWQVQRVVAAVEQAARERGWVTLAKEDRP